jgi:hypothetical protein
VLVVADHPDREAPSKDVSMATVTHVEPLGVDAVEVLHARRQALDRRLDNEVIVRAHEAVRMAVPAVASGDQGEEGDEKTSIDGVEVDLAREHATGRHVEDPVGQVGAPNAGHVVTLVRRTPRGGCCGRIGSAL